jgi:hypothetical protein
MNKKKERNSRQMFKTIQSLRIVNMLTVTKCYRWKAYETRKMLMLK